MATITPLEEGKKAFREGKPMLDNPYPRYTKKYDWWNLGWKNQWWDEGEKTWRPQ